MILYVAGPMAGYPNYNYDAFHATTAALRDLGHVVICPAESFGGDQGLPITDYARHDLHLLLQADGVVLLDGSGRSIGACTEIAVAAWLGLAFYCLDHGTLRAFHPENPCKIYAQSA
jgi:hypothetical protein